MADEELPRAAVVANEEWNAPAGGWDMSMVGKDGRSLAERLECAILFSGFFLRYARAHCLMFYLQASEEGGVEAVQVGQLAHGH